MTPRSVPTACFVAALTLAATSLAVAAPRIASAAGAGTTATDAFVVDSVGDENDAQLLDDACGTTAGTCTLRAAIQQANVRSGPDRIEFAIPGEGPHTILVDGSLPPLSDLTGGTTIDGYTQPGASANTDPLATNADLRIVIRPAVVVDDVATLPITSSHNVVRGLALTHGAFKMRISGTSAAHNRVVGNFIGTDPAGTHFDTNVVETIGIGVDAGATFNVVGTPDLADRNLLSGNSFWAVRADQTGTDHNLFQNNVVGLNPAGTGPLRQGGGFDIQFGASHNLVGGSGWREHNVLSGMSDRAAAIDFSHNTFFNRAVGNYIGTDLTGTRAYEWTANKRGVWIKDDARFNEITDNVIVNSLLEGVRHKHNYTGSNTFRNNLVGVTLDGTPAGNLSHGILLRGHDDVIERNVIAHNGGAGIFIDSLNDDGANGDELTERARISGNSFYSNVGLGIDIEADGPNTNDAGDLDVGTQALLNHPELDSVEAGLVTGTACAGCEVEVYDADADVALANGRHHLGTAIADGTGAFTFASGRILGGRSVTALTIDTANNTSEFAPVVAVGGTGNAGTLVPYTSEEGRFYETQFQGQPMALTPELGFINRKGADDTLGLVTFDVIAPVTGDYDVIGEVYAPNGHSNSFWVVVDDQPGDGYNWNLPIGSSLAEVALNDRGTPISLTLDAGPHRIVVAVREDGAGITRLGIFGDAVPPPSTVTLTAPTDQLTTRGELTSLQLAATPADVSYTALNLPDGLAVDPFTGTISGTPTRAGVFPATVWASVGSEIVTATFTWTVELEALPPVVDLVTDRVDAAGAAVDIVIGATDPNGDALSFGATGLPDGVAIDPLSGAITGAVQSSAITPVTSSVTITVSDGVFDTTTTFAWTVEPGFVCAVVGDTLSWSDQGANRYYIRLALDGDDSYVGSTTDTSYPAASEYGVYEVVHYLGGRTSTTCEAPGGPVAPAFTCSVVGTTLSWNDQNVSRYYLRYAIDGNESYLGSSDTLSYEVPFEFGTYIVVAYTSLGRQTTSCPAAGGPVAP